MIVAFEGLSLGTTTSNRIAVRKVLLEPDDPGLRRAAPGSNPTPCTANEPPCPCRGSGQRDRFRTTSSDASHAPSRTISPPPSARSLLRFSWSTACERNRVNPMLTTSLRERLSARRPGDRIHRLLARTRTSASTAQRSRDGHHTGRLSCHAGDGQRGRPPRDFNGGLDGRPARGSAAAVSESGSVLETARAATKQQPCGSGQASSQARIWGDCEERARHCGRRRSRPRA